MIVLDPPLPKLSGPDKVDVEIFYSYLDEFGRGIAFTGNVSLWNRWLHSVLDEDVEIYLRIREHEQIIASGPKVPTRFERQQRRAQELHYVSEWYRTEDQGDKEMGWRVLETLVGLGETGGLFNISTKEQWDEVLKKNGVSRSEWEDKTSEVRRTEDQQGR